MNHVIQPIRNFKNFATNRTAINYWFPEREEIESTGEYKNMKPATEVAISFKKEKSSLDA